MLVSFLITATFLDSQETPLLIQRFGFFAKLDVYDFPGMCIKVSQTFAFDWELKICFPPFVLFFSFMENVRLPSSDLLIGNLNTASLFGVFFPWLCFFTRCSSFC